MIRISERRLNYLVREENLTIDEFRERYHIDTFEYQYGIRNAGYDIAFDDPKYETIFKVKFGI